MGTGVTGYKEITGIYHGLHNMFQQVYLSYGIVLGSAFLYGIFAPIRIRKFEIKKWIPFIAIMLFVQTIQFINPAALMLPYVIAVYTLNLEENENEAVYHHS